MMDSNTIGSIVSKIQTDVYAALASKHDLLLGEGQDIALALLLVTVSWALIMWILSGNGIQALTDSMGTLTRYGFVALLLGTAVTAGGWNALVSEWFGGNVNAISTRVAGVSSVGDGTTLMLKAAASLFQTEEGAKQCQQVPIYYAGSNILQGYNTVCNGKPLTGEGQSWNPFYIAGTVLAALFGMVLKLVAVFFLGTMMVYFILTTLMATAAFEIGVILGPILVPWLIWQRSEFLFDGWLKYMIVAGMAKIVAALMVSIVMVIIVAARTVVDQSMLGDYALAAKTDLIAAFILAVVCAVGAFMMRQVPSIADALISGGSGTSTTGWGRGLFAQAAQKGVSTAFKSATSGGAKGSSAKGESTAGSNKNNWRD